MEGNVFGKERLAALSDGIFAIAMTVLVLGISAPDLPKADQESQVWSALVKVLPQFVAFVASFVTLAMYWVVHHTLFRFVARTDRVLLWMNMYFLLFVTLVPFTTQLYAGDANSRIVNCVFGANLILLGLLSYAMWSLACVRGLTGAEVDEGVRRLVASRTLTGPAVAALALTATLFQPVYAEYVYLAMAPVFMATVRLRMPSKWLKKPGNTPPPASSP